MVFAILAGHTNTIHHSAVPDLRSERSHNSGAVLNQPGMQTGQIWIFTDLDCGSALLG